MEIENCVEYAQTKILCVVLVWYPLISDSYLEVSFETDYLWNPL